MKIHWNNTYIYYDAKTSKTFLVTKSNKKPLILFKGDNAGTSIYLFLIFWFFFLLSISSNNKINLNLSPNKCVIIHFVFMFLNVCLFLVNNDTATSVWQIWHSIVNHFLVPIWLQQWQWMYSAQFQAPWMPSP